VLPVADGSACFEQGNTKVLVTVRGPREVRRRADALHDRAILDCSFSLAPFAKVRHAKKRYTDRNALETQIAIKQVG
jgi:exosome complex component RRP41